MIKSDARMAYEVKRLPYWQRVMVWPLQIAAAVTFLIVGCSKWIGAEGMVALFDEIEWGQAMLLNNMSWGQWLRYLMGSLQIVSAVLLLFPNRVFWGSLLLATSMVGGILLHLLWVGGNPVPAIMLFCITAIITWVRKPSEGLTRIGSPAK